MKVYIVIRCFGDHTRIERVFACRHQAEKIRDRLIKKTNAGNEGTFHVITKKVDDLRGLDIKALLNK